MSKKDKIKKQYKKGLALFLSLMIGCGNIQNADGEKQEEEPIRSVITIQNTSTGQQASSATEETDNPIFEYTKFIKRVDGLAVDENGQLYIIHCNSVPKQTTQEIAVYAWDGTRIKNEELDFSVGKATVFEWIDGSLYVVAPKVGDVPALYEINPETWEVQELYCFDTFAQISRVAFMENRVYVFGLLKNKDEKPFVQNLEYLESYRVNWYQGESIGYVDMENPDTGITLLPIDIPKDMIKLTEDTLGIYQMGEDARYFWKYTPAEEKWEKTDIAVSYYRSSFEEMMEKSATCEAFAGYGDGCIYVKNHGNFCYETVDGTETNLFTRDSSLTHWKTDGTYMFFYAYNSMGMGGHEIWRVQISDLLNAE